jgi:hypothetical protein
VVLTYKLRVEFDSIYAKMIIKKGNENKMEISVKTIIEILELYSPLFEH